jgi:hypothetical protein
MQMLWLLLHMPRGKLAMLAVQQAGQVLLLVVLVRQRQQA